MDKYFSIGEISKLFNLPIKTLHYYDERGLVKPAYVNSESHYRYYSVEQFILFDVIKNFWERNGGDIKAVQGDSCHAQVNRATDVYPSLEEKAANLLYFITKNHSFSDGNKRIAATMFLSYKNIIDH